MGVFGEAIGKLLCCARLGAIENHYIPALGKKKNPFSMVISHLANAWMKHRQRKCLRSGNLDCKPKGNQESAPVQDSKGLAENSRLSC